MSDGRHYLFTVRSAQPDAAGIYLGAFGSAQRTRLLGDISNAAYAASPDGTGYLLFARGRSLLAQTLDIEHGRLISDPVVVADNIWFSTTWSRAAFSISDSGVLVFDSTSRGRDHELIWFDRISNLRVHDLRHELGSQMLEAGVHDVQITHGQENITTTSTYLHPTPDGERECFEKLAAMRRRKRLRLVS